MTTKNLFLGLLALLLQVTFSYGQDLIWQQVPSEELPQQLRIKQPATVLSLYQINIPALSSMLQHAPYEHTVQTRQKAVEVLLPGLMGDMQRFKVLKTSILTKEVAAQYPLIQTYTGVGIDDASIRVRITTGYNGLNIFMTGADGTCMLQPIEGENPQNLHIKYNVKDEIVEDEACLMGVLDEQIQANVYSPYKTAFGDGQFRSFDLAIATTGEYTVGWGGQAAVLSQLTGIINNINLVYERDFGIHLNLVTNNNIMFTNAATDPYTAPWDLMTLINENNAAINNNLGTSFDLGYAWSASFSGGASYTGIVCGGFKTGIGTGTYAPLTYSHLMHVAHEVGHAFGAYHSYSAINGTCAPPQNTAFTSWEPGGGSTIEAYTSKCTGNFYQVHRDQYFHAGSIGQVAAYFPNYSVAGCETIIPTSNHQPVLSLPANAYTVPAGTPYRLSANATDIDGDIITYNWDQMNPDQSTTAPSPTATTGPTFRSYPPSKDNFRYFPPLYTLVRGLPTPYEVLSTVCRTINFTVTARDNAINQPFTDNEDVAITTDCASGPFLVISQAVPTSFTANGTNTFTVAWNVAGTNAGLVNCANVKISFSTDGGYNYPYILAASTPNDGSETFVVPNYPTVTGRIKVEAVGNVFFHINTADITILSTCAAQSANIDNTGTLSAPENDPSLNFTINNLFGTVISLPFTGTITASDIPTDFAAFGVSNIPCQVFNHLQAYYQAPIEFEVDVAGTYTFTNTTPANQMNMAIYEGKFDPALLCHNIIGTCYIVNVMNAFTTVTLSPNKKYNIVFHSSDQNISFPLNYNVSVTMPTGASLITAPLAPAGYLYSYLIINETTNTIVGISPTNVIDMTSYSMGNYRVYGISHDALNLNPFIGTNFSTFANTTLPNLGVCGKLSLLSKPVNISAPLPVELLALTSQAIRNDISIAWQTQNESGLDYYRIEHADASLNFEEIGQLPARNFENTTNYDFLHKNVSMGKHYYRLYAVDIDGKEAYKGMTISTIATSTAKLYPNPAEHSLTLTFDAVNSIQNLCMIDVYDVIGKKVYHDTVPLVNGTNQHNISIEGLPKGAYFLRYNNGQEVNMLPFVKE